MSDPTFNNEGLMSADFPGDEAFLPGLMCESAKPGLLVNPNATELELLSGAIHRLENALDLFWLVLDQVQDRQSVPGGLTTIGRLCSEAHAMNRVCLDQLVSIQQSKPVKRAKGLG